MKKITILFAAALAAAVTFGQTKEAKQESLASARAKITQVIEKPSQMKEVMRLLTASNQVVFLSEVITAVSKMPGDNADRTAKLVEVVNAALAGAQPGNALALVAEVFATVPPSSLPAVTEDLASGLMNRASDSGRTYTDGEYTEIAQKVMDTVNKRVEGEENADVRSGFAAVMLIEASNSKSPEIIAAVENALPESVREEAKTDWIPAAIGQGQDKSYDSMLAGVEGDVTKPGEGGAESGSSVSAASSGGAGDSDQIVSLRAPVVQGRDSLLADIGGTVTDPTAAAGSNTPIVDAVSDTFNVTLPLGTGEAAGVGGGDSIVEHVEKEAEEEKPVEPDGYPNQTSH